jgi:IS5 family transposase
MWTADRRAPRQGKNLETASTQEQNGHQHRIHESQHPRVEHPFRIIKLVFSFVKARCKGLLKNDNQLAMLFTLANLFRADQMIRQWRDLTKNWG